MRYITGFLLLLSLLACAGRSVLSYVRFTASPRIQTSWTERQVCFDLTVLGPMPAPAVFEVLEESVFGLLEPVSRSIWHGDRQRQVCGPGWSNDYFIQRNRAHEFEQLQRQEAVTQGGLLPDISGAEEWDGMVTVQFVLRAPRVDDFAGAVSRDELESRFGRADGAIYRQTVVQVKLSCHCSI